VSLRKHVVCGVFVVGALFVLSCKGEQELRDDCPSAGGACPACATDADCFILSNPCHESAVCTHRRREPALAVNQIGCNSEYDLPPADKCGCVDAVCRSR
jgi:hypothetical protein